MSPLLLGALIHSVFVLLACVIVPLAMGSNIWPIATVFWSVLSVPPAALTGLIAGLLLRSQPRGVALAVQATTGIALAVAVGFIMAQT